MIARQGPIVWLLAGLVVSSVVLAAWTINRTGGGPRRRAGRVIALTLLASTACCGWVFARPVAQCNAVPTIMALNVQAGDGLGGDEIADATWASMCRAEGRHALESVTGLAIPLWAITMCVIGGVLMISRRPEEYDAGPTTGPVFPLDAEYAQRPLM